MTTTVTIAAGADKHVEVNEHEGLNGPVRYTYYIGSGASRSFDVNPGAAISVLEVDISALERTIQDEA